LKRWYWIAVGLIVLFLLPEGQGMDVSQLQPMELIYICMEEGRVVVRTDTGDEGSGNTLDTALMNLHASSNGKVFLDTADYVLVTEDTKDLIEEMGGILRLSARVILASGQIDPEAVPQYLAAHDSRVTLKDCMSGEQTLPKLMTAGKRYYLVQ